MRTQRGDTVGTILDGLSEEIRRIPVLSSAEEAALIARKCAGQPGRWRGKHYVRPEGGVWTPDAWAARERLIVANIRLVWAVAAQYNQRTSTPLADRIQEGVIGLMRAVERFDPRRGGKLSTYAVYWVRQAMTRAMEQDNLVHVPVHVQEKQHQRDRDVERGTSPYVLAADRFITVFSLDEQLAEDSPETLGTLLAAPGDDMATTVETVSMWHDLAHLLPPRQAQVLRLRYGLDGENPHTLEATGHRLGGLSRERVRQIECDALDTLRAHYGLIPWRRQATA